MNLSLPNICKQAHPFITFPTPNTHHDQADNKVVIVMGATGTGKSRLAIDLASRFPAEIINSDKIQMYKGLDIVTNKVTEEECDGIPHHLLGIIDDPNVDFTASDFTRLAFEAIDSIVGRGRVPIVAGGSNSFIQALVEGGNYRSSRYVYCLIWVDVFPPVLRRFVSTRVDQMVEKGLVEEVKGIFDPKADYTRGIRRAIGVPELDKYIRSQGNLPDAIAEIKENTWDLAQRQTSKIRRLRDSRGWHVHRVDATEAFEKSGKEADVAWERLVVGPAAKIAGRFLSDKGGVVNTMNPRGKSVISRSVPLSSPVVATPAVVSS